MDIGSTLKAHREAKGISLGELSKLTRVPERHLRELEEDRLAELPGDVFAKGFIRAHARATGADADALLRAFDARRAPRAESVPNVPAAIVQDTDRDKRVGVAVALVVLLILFTLALSIVLQPRQRNVPVELSLAPAAEGVAGGAQG